MVSDLITQHASSFYPRQNMNGLSTYLETICRYFKSDSHSYFTTFHLLILERLFRDKTSQTRLVFILSLNPLLCGKMLNKEISFEIRRTAHFSGN